MASVPPIDPPVDPSVDPIQNSPIIPPQTPEPNFSLYGQEISPVTDENEVFKTCFEEAPLPIIVLSAEDKRIVFWNRAAEIKFGFMRIEAIGQEISIIFPDDEMSMAEHDKKVENFGKEQRSRSTFGSSRIIKAKARSGQIFDVLINVFKFGAGENLLIGGYISDITRERQLISKVEQQNDSLKKTVALIKSRNSDLARSNRDLDMARQAAEFRMQRARSQDRITNRLMIFIITVIVGTLVLSSFVRLNETVLAFVKDSSLLLLGILSGAIGGIFGNKEDKSTFSSSGTYQPPIIPTIDEFGQLNQKPVQEPYNQSPYRNTYSQPPNNQPPTNPDAQFNDEQF